ncbi:MAG: hypothetical protein M0029_05975 [Actinomycetota bacterium]|nr:hypothetical protein [Actinomycetota bacterium]
MGNGGPWTGSPLPVGGLLGEERDDVGVEVVDGVLGDGGPHEGVMVGLVVADFEPEALEERPQDVLGGVEEVGVDDGERVEQFDGDGLGFFGRFEGGKGCELGLSLCLEFAEPVADAGEDGAGGVVLGFEGADESVLAPGDLVEGSVQRVEAGGLLGDGVVVELAEVGGEQLGACGAEEAGGEELGDPGE